MASIQPGHEIAGIVAAQRPQMTRRGKMVFVTLDDGSAAVEVSVFNELFEAQRRLIRDDELLVVPGKVSRDDYSGGQRIVAERLPDLASARPEFGKPPRTRRNGIPAGASPPAPPNTRPPPRRCPAHPRPRTPRASPHRRRSPRPHP